MLTSIKGKSVIVTGSSKGIGKGIARVFAKQGANVMLGARDGDAAAAAAAEIGHGAKSCSADVGDWDQCQAMAKATADAFGGIDIVCANAGVYPQTKLEDMDPAEWDLVIGTNLKGNFLTVKACLPWLKQSGEGRVILTSSITGPVTGFPGWAHYGASKSGQLGFMRTACIELAKYGITVNAVLPGNIITEGLEGLGDDYLKTMAASIPLKKLGRVEDIGNVALFLASREANYITGQTIIVDGGQILPESLEAIEQA
jgi:3-oxoacyl-[acyl-carrier protein] reductase